MWINYQSAAKINDRHSINKLFVYKESRLTFIIGPAILMAAGIIIFFTFKKLAVISFIFIVFGGLGIVHGVFRKRKEIKLDKEKLITGDVCLKVKDIRGVVRTDYNESIYYKVTLRSSHVEVIKAPFSPRKEAELWNLLQGLNEL